jgi:hypothetical protein
MINFLKDKLSQKQKYYLAGGAIFVAFLLILQSLFIPVWEERQKIRSALDVNENRLKEMKILGLEYQGLKQGEKIIQTAMSRKPRDFTLFSYVEKKAGEVGISSNIRSIIPSKTVTSDSYEGTAIDIRLEKITLKQLINFLYLVESQQDLIKVKKISLSKNKEKAEYLNVSMQVVTYQLSSGQGK